MPTRLFSAGRQRLRSLVDGPGTAISGSGDAAFGDSIGLRVEHGTSCLTIKGLAPAGSKGLG